MKNNVLILLSDEHSPLCMGNMKHYICKTPNLDKLAFQGTKFTNAYCTSPICVPSRTGIATGLYTYQNKSWDNAFPYDGKIKSWGHILQNYGHQCVSIGKLHFKNEKISSGFSEQLQPMHVINGVGDLMGSIRKKPVVRTGARKYIDEAGIGKSTYQDYDKKTADLAIQWLKNKSLKKEEKGWVLFVSFAVPHFPLKVTRSFASLYPLSKILAPINHLRQKTLHPAHQTYANLMGFEPKFTEKQIKRAIRSYFGLITFMDFQIGRILQSLNKYNLNKNTTIIYTSDHGDNVGRDGLFGKSTMYEESVGVPLIAKGKKFKKNFVSNKIVSHIDLYATILESVDIGIKYKNKDYKGISLQSSLNNKNRKHPVISEYHATCSTGGITMIREKKYKFIYYVNHSCQLFNLGKDPDELNDLSHNPRYKNKIKYFKKKISKYFDPHKIDELVNHDQLKLIKKHGGRKKILSQGTLGYTPVPGEKPDISKKIKEKNHTI